MAKRNNNHFLTRTAAITLAIMSRSLSIAIGYTLVFAAEKGITLSKGFAMLMTLAVSLTLGLAVATKFAIIVLIQVCIQLKRFLLAVL